MVSLPYCWFTNFIHAGNNISYLQSDGDDLCKFWGIYCTILFFSDVPVCRCMSVPSIRRLLVPACSGSSSIILWHSITLLNTWICNSTTVRTSVWSYFASKFQQYAVFQTYKSHILVDYLTICDHLVIFLENCAAGQCIPMKPAKYKDFCCHWCDSFIYRACAVVQSRNRKDKNHSASVWSGFVQAIQMLSTLFAWKRGGMHLA